ncbi:hypothetical protein [Catellatospora tritici]|uniref:hypothetical protein n=1 Tax=Catellatospora tritici TaxID=2851566 RepID=UPI001C2D877C|nr:hypothetical protein [Catellatospora tritici]MBV1855723.1 hypothetical protein [Catellatospora tritici]
MWSLALSAVVVGTVTFVWPDPTPPPPASFAADAAFDSVTLRWSPSPRDEEVAAYELYRDDTRIFSGRTTSVTDTDVSSGGAYVYTLKAISTKGKTSRPVQVPVTVRTKSSEFQPPKHLVVNALPGGQIGLAWSPPATAAQNVRFSVFRNKIKIGETANLYYIDDTRDTRSPISYTVRAVDFANNAESIDSVAVSITTLAPGRTPQTPPPPLNLAQAITGDGALRLTWEPPVGGIALIAYRVYRDGQLIGLAAGTNFAVNDSELGSDAAYTVRALYVGGQESSDSAPVNIFAKAAFSVTDCAATLSVTIKGKVNGSLWLLIQPLNSSRYFPFPTPGVKSGNEWRFDGVSVPYSGIYRAWFIALTPPQSAALMRAAVVDGSVDNLPSSPTIRSLPLYKSGADCS